VLYWLYKNAGLYAIPYRESGFRDVIMDKIDLTYESDFDENDSNYFSMSVGKREIHYATICDVNKNHHVFEFYVDYDYIKKIFSYEIWEYELDKKKTYYKTIFVSLSEFKDNYAYNDDSTHDGIILNFLQEEIKTKFCNWMYK